MRLVTVCKSKEEADKLASKLSREGTKGVVVIPTRRGRYKVVSTLVRELGFGNFKNVGF